MRSVPNYLPDPGSVAAAATAASRPAAATTAAARHAGSPPGAATRRPADADGVYVPGPGHDAATSDATG